MATPVEVVHRLASGRVTRSWRWWLYRDGSWRPASPGHDDGVWEARTGSWTRPTDYAVLACRTALPLLVRYLGV